MTKIQLARTINMETGQTIRNLRTQLGVSQEELAFAIGIEQSLVSKIELERVKSPRTRFKLCEALNSWPSN